MDDAKENASDKDILEGKSTITKPFRYVMPQSEINERILNSEKGKNKELISDNDNHDEMVKKIIVETMQEDSETVISRMKEEIPNFDEDKYRKDYMKAIELEINSGKTEEEKEKFRKQFLAYDLLELQNTGGTSDSRKIRNVLRENYTHNKLLHGIKNKGSRVNITEESNKHLKDTEDLFE